MKLDGHSAPEDVIAEGSALWGVFKGFRSLGLHLLQIPKGLGGMAEDLDPMAAILVTEQLGYADSGLTLSDRENQKACVLEMLSSLANIFRLNHFPFRGNLKVYLIPSAKTFAFLQSD